MSSKPVFYDGVAGHERSNNTLNAFIAMTDNKTMQFVSCNLLSICPALASLSLLSTSRG